MMDIHTLSMVFLLACLLITTLAMTLLRHVLAVVILSGIFSLLMALLYLLMAAPDVAITEAAIGAGLSTILFLSVLALVDAKEPQSSGRVVPSLLITTITGALLVYATLDLPNFGSATAPSQTHVAPYYLKDTEPRAGVPNVVTVTLASYRGFDTLGETFVIFTAAVAVCVLLAPTFHARRRRPLEKDHANNT